MFITMHSEQMAKHWINLEDLVVSTVSVVCSNFDMIYLRYHGAGSQAKACFVCT